METLSVETAEKEKEKVAHYLDREDIHQVVKENWPDLIPKLSEVTYPQESSHPDELEKWEVQKRLDRIALLNEHNGLESLQMLLYEECFGVRSFFGETEPFRDSLAPSPGGMVSHGHPMNVVDGASLEMLPEYDLHGSTAQEVIMSIEDRSKKEKLATLMAQTLYPTGFNSNYLNGGRNRVTRMALLNPDLQPKEETNTWALRLLKLVKTQSLNENVEDGELREILNINPGVEISLATYWTLLWRKMSLLFISDGGFRQPEDPAVKDAIGILLKVRLNPAAGVFFSYYSPSGYLNDIDVGSNL